MSLLLGNAPCSWGVEFANDERNPSWEQVLAECASAGYKGIELGPIGFMPEDPVILKAALSQYSLTLIGGVLFSPFHDPNAWQDLYRDAKRTCDALIAHGAEHLVLIDSISPRRAATAGRPDEAEVMSEEEMSAYIDRFRTIAKMGAHEYGLTVSLHPHAGGFMDYLPEVEQLLEAIDPSILKLCVDTGHCSYAGYDYLTFIKKYIERISYLHFKSTDPKIKATVIENRTDFYDACGQGLFCNLSEGEVDFNAVKQVLIEGGYSGWCTVEQDCDPTLNPNPLREAKLNLAFLESIGFNEGA